MVSYKKGLPDTGIDALRSELMNTLNSTAAQLNQRINDLQARVAVLEQAGNLTITTIVIDSTSRTITVQGSATDHDTGATVNITINDSQGGTISGSTTLTGSGTQTFSRQLDVNPLSAGLLTIRATSIDRFGRAKEATESRNYTVNNSAILITTASINNTTSLLNVIATADLQFPTAEDNVKDLRLEVSIAGGVTNTFVPTSHNASGPTATWENIDLSTYGYGSGTLILKVFGTDKFGEYKEVTNTSNTYDPSVGGFLSIDSIVVDDVARNCDIRGTIWAADAGSTVNINVSGRTLSATVYADWIGSRTQPHQQNSEAKQFRLDDFNLNGLSFGSLVMNASATDRASRSVSDDQSFNFRPVGSGVTFTTMDNTNKNLRVTGNCDYSNSSEPVTITVTSDGGGAPLVVTTAIDGAGQIDTTFSVAALPFGNLSIKTDVTTLSGNIWTQTRAEVFQAVTGDITITSAVIDSANDSMSVSWNVNNATATKVEVTDSTGVKRSETGASIVGTSHTLDITGLAFGPMTIKVYGEDVGGGSVVDSDTKTYYDQSGSILISTAAANTATGQLQLTVDTSNVAPGSSVTYNITGQGSKSGSFTVTSNRTTTTISLAGIGYGANNISVQATDLKGSAVNDARNFTYSLPGTITVTSVTVNSPSSQINVSGTTSSVNAGASVTVTIRDTGGKSVSSTASVVGGDWSKSGMSISTLDYGDLTVEVSVLDTYGLTASDSSGPHAYNNLSGFVNIQSFTHVGSVATVSGVSSNVGNGININLEVRDGNGATPHVVRSTTVDGAGNFSFTNVDLTNLDFGTLTAEAVTTDLAGDTIRDTETLTYIAPTGTVSISEFTVASTESNSSGGYGTLDVSGTVTDIKSGTNVTVTFWSDANPSYKITTSVPVSGGTYNAANISVSGLEDGTISAQATITDVGGVTRNSSIPTAAMARGGTIETVSIVLNDSNFDPSVDHYYDYIIEVTGTVSGNFGSNDNRLVGVSPTSSGSSKPLTPERTGNTYFASTTGSGFQDVAGIRAVLTLFDMSGKQHSKMSSNTIDIYDGGNIYAPTFTISTANSQARIDGRCTNVPNGAAINVVIKRGAVTVSSFTTLVTATRYPEGFWYGTFDTGAFDISSWEYGTYTVYVSANDMMGNEVTDQSSATYEDPRPDGTVTVSGAEATREGGGGDFNNEPTIDYISAFGQSTNMEVGANVTAKIYQGGTVKYTLNGSVIENGNWSVSHYSTDNLSPGEFTVVAEIVDQKGILRTGSGTGYYVISSGNGPGPI